MGKDFADTHPSERRRFVRVRDTRVRELIDREDARGNFYVAWNMLSFQRGQRVARAALRLAVALAGLRLADFPLLLS